LRFQAQRGLAFYFCNLAAFVMQMGAVIGFFWFVSVVIAPRLLRLFFR
jgi:hypothetical protein